MLSFLAGCELTDASYTLHMEAMAALLVCMSTQMFCELSSAAPQPLAAAVLRSEAGIARRVVARLLQHYMRRPAPPKEAEGVDVPVVGGAVSDRVPALRGRRQVADACTHKDQTRHIARHGSRAAYIARLVPTTWEQCSQRWILFCIAGMQKGRN